MSRRTTVIVAAILVLIGVVWLLQGIGVLGGSAMTGSSFWGWVGGLCIVAGGVLVARLARREP